MKVLRKIQVLLIVGATACAFLGWSVLGESPAPADVEKELHSVNERYTEAIRRTDAAGLESVTTEGFLYVNEKGAVLPRAFMATAFRAGAIQYEKVTFEDEAIHVNGDTAWITGKYTIKGAMSGAPFDAVCRAVRVFTKTPNGWLAAHAQLTKVQ